MNTQEVINYMRNEFSHAVHGVSEQWGSLRQRANHSLVAFHQGEHAEWALIAVDMLEVEDQLLLRVEIPGMHTEALDVSIEGSELIIAGDKTCPLTMGAVTGEDLYSEAIYGSFERRIPLPHRHLAEAEISANYADGILMLEIPLKPQEALPSRKISIH